MSQGYTRDYTVDTNPPPDPVAPAYLKVARSSSTVNVSGGSTSPITWQDIVHIVDNDGVFGFDGSTPDVPILKPCLLDIRVQVYWTGISDGPLHVYLYKNLDLVAWSTSSAQGGPRQQVSIVEPFDAGDTVRVQVHNGGSSSVSYRGTISSTRYTWLSLLRVHPL